MHPGIKEAFSHCYFSVSQEKIRFFTERNEMIPRVVLSASLLILFMLTFPLSTLDMHKYANARDSPGGMEHGTERVKNRISSIMNPNPNIQIRFLHIISNYYSWVLGRIESHFRPNGSSNIKHAHPVPVDRRKNKTFSQS